MTDNRIRLSVDRTMELVSITVVDEHGAVVLNRLLNFEETSRLGRMLLARPDFDAIQDERVNLADVMIEALDPE